MKVYFKKHKQGFNEVCAACDENILGKKITTNKIEVNVSEGFYKGDLIDIEEALIRLERSGNINIIGEHIVKAAIESLNCGLLISACPGVYSFLNYRNTHCSKPY